jgi:isoleucyl-tRNA synthetase
MISNANPWDNLKFDLEELLRFAENSLELYTTYSFFSLYANMMVLNMKKIPVKRRPEMINGLSQN